MYIFRHKFGIVSLIKLLYIVFNTVGSVEGIRSGQNARDGELTYQVAVLINRMHACGGAILNSRNVMSGGQCVLDEGGYFLNVQFHIIYGVSPSSGWGHREQIKVQYIYILYDFRPPNRTNYLFPQGLENGDLSILQLERGIPLGSGTGINSVGLPVLVQYRYQRYTHMLGKVSGFGLNQPTDYKSSSNISSLGYRRNLHGELNYVLQKVQRLDICKTRYPQLYEADWINHLCAYSDGYNPMGACFGDVGGPLVRENELIGVLQIYTAGCDDRRVPAIYTRVSEYLEFIDDALENRFEVNMRLGNYTGASVNETPHPGRQG